MKGKGGYLLIDLASNNVFNELLIAMEFGKPILLKDGKQNFFADLISGGEVTSYVLDEDNEPTDEPLTYSDITIVFGGGVITVEQDNDVTISYNEDEINTEELNADYINTEAINIYAESPNWTINDDGELQTNDGVIYRTDGVGNIGEAFSFIGGTGELPNTFSLDLDEGDILFNGTSVLGGGGTTPYLEDIIDSDNHYRFIQGSAEGDSITGITYDYANWSLSGTHLMVVLSLTLDANTSLSHNSRIGTLNDLPSWVIDKIVNISGSNIVVRKNFKDDWYTTAGVAIGQNFYVALEKDTGQIDIRPQSAISANDATQIRIQFDLLIDNN